jgi:hypothetical protein
MAGLWRKSPRGCVHMFHRVKHFSAIFSRHRRSTGWRNRLTVIALRIEWFPRAAPKRRHVLFPAPVADASVNARIAAEP